MDFVFVFILYSVLLTHICINGRVLNHIGRLYIPGIGINGAENSAIDVETNRIFTADGQSKAVNVLSFDIDSNFTSADISEHKFINMTDPFFDININITLHDITSVAINIPKYFVLATLVPDMYWIEYGWLAFIDPVNLTVFYLFEMEECYLPDHVSVSNSGNILIISCEGEPNENDNQFPEYNPPGSIGIIDVSSLNISDWEYFNINFTEFNYGGDKYDLLPKDIYIPHLGNISHAIEPEFSVVDHNDKYAYISLQENNCIAILDIENREIINIFSLGYTNFGLNGGLDPSDRDDAINIEEYMNVFGMRQPDDIDYYYDINTDRQFIFTANEGDSKDFDESRVHSLQLDPDVFGSSNITDILQDDEYLGRLKVSNLVGDSNGDGLFEKLITFSSRDFTIFEVITDGVPNNISLIYQSDNQFENITATLFPNNFNSDYDVPSFDSRSDAKGPEPEALTIGECDNGRLYVFIAFERMGGIIVYDFTDIDNVHYVDYYNNRNFSVYYDKDERPPINAGDVAPEHIAFISEEYYGEALLVVTNTQSSSISMYRVDCGESPITTTNTNTPTDDSDDTQLTTIEIVLISVGSFVIISIIAILIFLCYKKRRNPMDDYKYNSVYEPLDKNNKSNAYFELEK